MGFWRDIGSVFGICDHISRRDREEYEKDHAATVTKHPRGCTCHWCGLARVGTKVPGDEW